MTLPAPSKTVPNFVDKNKNQGLSSHFQQHFIHMEHVMGWGGVREGQGRPNILGESKSITARIPVELWEKIAKKAESEKKSVSTFLRDLLEKHFA